MSRIRSVRCLPCGKKSYPDEETARAALGNVLIGHWKGGDERNYALGVYRCWHRRSSWHIGHNKKTIEAMEGMMKLPKALSPGEECFALHCAAHLLTPSREHQFHTGRKWALDFAWPERKLAVEIEGGTKLNGRHNRHTGFTADCEKYNAAALAGWKVLRYTTDMVFAGKAINDVLEMMP